MSTHERKPEDGDDSVPAPELDRAEHDAALQAAQLTTEGFVWGWRTDLDAPWFLEDDAARDERKFVRANVVCPVPACGAELTTVHRKRRRDHLRHLRSSIANHSSESFLHGQGCAQVAAWLIKRYPHSHVEREVYTSPSGELRADVLVTGRDTGEGTLPIRVAFEVQYSPFHDGEWERRHSAYEAAGVLDVWLFGSTGRQSPHWSSRRLSPRISHSDVHDASGVLLFIDPLGRQPECTSTAEPHLGITVGRRARFDLERGIFGGLVDVLGTLSDADVEWHPLDTFSLDSEKGISSPRLRALRDATIALQHHNEEAERAYAEREAQRRLVADQAREAAQRHGERVTQQRETWRERIRLLIREALSDPEGWRLTDGYRETRRFFAASWTNKERLDPRQFSAAGIQLWQDLAYFDLISGHAGEPFTAEHVRRVARDHGLVLAARDDERIEGYLEWLSGYGLIDVVYDVDDVNDGDRGRRYVATEQGAR